MVGPVGEESENRYLSITLFIVHDNENMRLSPYKVTLSHESFSMCICFSIILLVRKSKCTSPFHHLGCSDWQQEVNQWSTNDRRKTIN